MTDSQLEFAGVVIDGSHPLCSLFKRHFELWVKQIIGEKSPMLPKNYSWCLTFEA